MKSENEMFKDIWNQDGKKKHIRVTINSNATEYVGKTAFNDFGLGRSSVSLEISKLILIGKYCIEKEGPAAWQEIVNQLESSSKK